MISAIIPSFRKRASQYRVMLRTPPHFPPSAGNGSDPSRDRSSFAVPLPVPGGEGTTVASLDVPMPPTRSDGSRRRRQGRDRTGGGARNRRAVHVALAQEAHDIALLVAVTGSIVNAIVAGRRPQLRTSMAAYLPGQPSLFTASIGSDTASTALTPPTVQSLIAFYGLVNFARSATLGYSAKREPGGIAGPISMETLGEAWQAAATQAIGTLSLLGYLDGDSILFSEGRDYAAATRLVEMLWGVTLGRSPCVRIDGAIIVPGWIERRTHLRREINAPGVLTVRGTQQRVVVRDLSAGGIGVEGAKAVAPGDRVRVSIGDGMHFDGAVIWQRENRIGVKLIEPPKTANPLVDD